MAPALDIIHSATYTIIPATFECLSTVTVRHSERRSEAKGEVSVEGSQRLFGNDTEKMIGGKFKT